MKRIVLYLNHKNFYLLLLILPLFFSCSDNDMLKETEKSRKAFKKELENQLLFTQFSIYKMKDKVEKKGNRKADLKAFNEARNFYDSTYYYFYLIDTLKTVPVNLKNELNKFLNLEHCGADYHIGSLDDVLDIQYLLVLKLKALSNCYLQIGSKDIEFSIAPTINKIHDPDTLDTNDSIYAEHIFLETSNYKNSEICMLKGGSLSDIFEFSSTIQINLVLNYFEFSLPVTAEDIELNYSIHPAPWKKEHFLLSINVSNNTTDTFAINNLLTEFNPDLVKSYRLLGFEGFPIEEEHSKECLNELYNDDLFVYKPGEEFTIQYELQLYDNQLNENFIIGNYFFVFSPTWAQDPYTGATIPAGRMQEKYGELAYTGETHPEFKVAAAITEAVLALKNSKYKGNASIDSALTILKADQRSKSSKDRLTLIRLLEYYQNNYAEHPI